jgi:hypothetical protein
MSNVNYNEMTNKELQALIDDFELTVQAKTPNKPTKAELIATLDAFKKEQNRINGIDDEDDTENDELVGEENSGSTKPKKVDDVAKPARSYSKAERKKLQIADLLRKERVLIYDVQDNQTKTPAITVTWGNSLIGFHSDVINLESGKPQYVRRGALANLRNATFTRSIQEEEFGPVKNIVEERFNIKELDGLTEEEIEILASKQKMFNAKAGF